MHCDEYCDEVITKQGNMLVLSGEMAFPVL